MSTEENESVEMESDDSSSDDADDDSKEQELLKRAEQLEQQISANKYLYDAHSELVSIYKKLTDLTSLRAAYERFHECFPLTPTIWLEWLKEEMNLACNVEDHKKIFGLFDEAVKDYISVDLWVEYIKFALSVSDLKTAYEIVDKAISAAGLHTSKGSLLWDSLRELQLAPLTLIADEEIGQDEWKVQVERVAEVYRRQLSVPLIEMENTYMEWQQWQRTLPDGTVDPKPIEWAYKKAVKTLETYRAFEEKLLAPENDEELYKIFQEYLKIVADPSAVLCLYERAVEKLCLIPKLWVDYCTYSFKLGEVAMNVSARALRNCPWCEELWIIRLRVLENQQGDASDVMACFELGVSSIAPAAGLNLWLAYLEYLRRCSDDTEKLDKLFSQAINQLGLKNDPSAKLNRWHARLLAQRGSMPEARKLWTALLRHPQNKGAASVWLEYASLERQYGEPHQVRTIFQRALSASTDWPQFIAEEWLMFEREFGTLQDVMKCADKCKTVEARHVPKPVSREGESEAEPKGKKRKFEENPSTSKKGKFERETTKKFDREKVIAEPPPRKVFEKDPTKTVFVSNLRPNVTEEKLKEVFPNAKVVDLVFDRKGKSRCYGYVHFAMEEEAMTALARDREPLDGRPIFISNCKTDKTDRKPVFKYVAAPEGHKLFVRGLPVTKTQQDVEDIFKPYGAVAVRLVIHKSGQPKGLAYVEFENEEAAKNAMKLTDNMTIDEHTISVAISAPPPKKSGATIPEPSSFRNARTRLQMIPRSVQVKPNDGKASSNGSELPSKSNAEFRNMFLKK